jgi:hypothetical protein
MGQGAARAALIFLALLAVGVLGRLMPHAPNFGPIAAVALFAGLTIRSRAMAAFVPVTALLIGDCFIGFYQWQVMVAVYLSLSLPVLVRPNIAGRSGPARLGLWAVGCSLMFFVVSNAATWAFGGLYGRTLPELLQCYVMALPFLKYTLMGDLVWSAVLLTGYYAVTQLSHIAALDSAERLVPELVRG